MCFWESVDQSEREDYLHCNQASSSCRDSVGETFHGGSWASDDVNNGIDETPRASIPEQPY